MCETINIDFQKSVLSGILPSAWKEVRITPIYKKGNKTESSNYRPMSLTAIVCMTLEKLVRKLKLSHLTENYLLSDKQYEGPDGGFGIHYSLKI